MPDAERPGGGEARPRLLAFRGGTTRRPSVEPGDLARRLANLERQVEAALAGAAPAASRLDAALDRLLDRYAETRRWLAERVAAAGGVSGLALEAAYRWWWRVETHGLERVPGSGRVLLVANRAGTLLPYDALMLPIALAVDHPRHRRAYAVVDEELLRLPIVGSALAHRAALAGGPAARGARHRRADRAGRRHRRGGGAARARPLGWALWPAGAAGHADVPLARPGRPRAAADEVDDLRGRPARGRAALPAGGGAGRRGGAPAARSGARAAAGGRERGAAPSPGALLLMRYVVGLDQGTTGTTALVFDRRGRLAARAYREFTQHYPQPGWVEHDPEEIWRVTLGVLRTAVRRAGARGRDVAALGITNQRETTVLWDRRTGRAVHRAIVWQDRRTAERCAALRAKGLEARVRAKTGLVLDPYFSATKLAWLLEHVRGAAKRAAQGELCFGTIDSWLLWRLTAGAVHATDPTNASRTLLFDIRARAWDPELCDLFGIPASLLPAVRPSSGLFGETAPEVLGVPVPVAGVAGDQQAALFGQGCVEPGLAKNTYGTGCFLLLHTGDRPIGSDRGLLTTIACDARGGAAYALEGSVFIAGAALQWVRDGLRL